MSHIYYTLMGTVLFFKKVKVEVNLILYKGV